MSDDRGSGPPAGETTEGGPPPNPDPLSGGAGSAPPVPVGTRPEDATVGTGSIFAIACSVLALLGILVGVAVFVLLRAF